MFLVTLRILENLSNKKVRSGPVLQAQTHVARRTLLCYFDEFLVRNTIEALQLSVLENHSSFRLGDIVHSLKVITVAIRSVTKGMGLGSVVVEMLRHRSKELLVSFYNLFSIKSQSIIKPHCLPGETMRSVC